MNLPFVKSHRSLACILAFGVVLLMPSVHADSELSTQRQRELVKLTDELNGQIAIDGNNLQARIDLAYVLLEGKNDIAAALEQAEAIQRKDPDNLHLNILFYRIAKATGDDHRQYRALLELVKSDHPMRPYWLRELRSFSLDSYQHNLEVIQALQDVSYHARHGTYARILEAREREILGQWDQARALYRSLNYIRDWRVIGPFKNERDSGFSQAESPEREIDFDKTYEGRQGVVAWRDLPQALAQPDGEIHFTDFMYPNDQSMAYAVTYVFSPVPQLAVMMMGAEASVKVWVNDELRLTDDRPHLYMTDQYTTSIMLNRGWNKVLVKLTRRDNGWRFSMRIVGENFKPLPGVEYSSDKKKAGKATQAVVSHPEMLSNIELLKLNTKPKPPLGLLDQLKLASWGMMLTEALLYEGRYQEAVKAAEFMLKNAPYSANAHYFVALAYQRNQQSQKALDHINQSIRYNPDHYAARDLMIKHYMSNGLEDRALDMAISLTDHYPNSILAAQTLASAYGNKNFNEHVYRIARELAAKHPTRIDLNLRFNQLKRARGDEAAYRFFVRQIGERIPRHYAVRSLEVKLLNESQDEVGKLTRILREINFYPYRLSLRYALVNQLMRMKKYNEAIEQLHLIQELQPQAPRVDLLFADIYMRQGQDDNAALAMRTALNKDPRNTQLRDYLRFLKPRKNAALAHYALKHDMVQRLIKDRVKAENYPRANAAMLLDFMVTQLHNDGSTDNHVHQVIQIFNENGRDEYKTYSLPSYDTRVKIARVIKPDGSRADATEIRGGQIHFARLQPGDTIEIQMEYHLGDRGWLSRQWYSAWYFQGNEPFIYSEYILLHDKQRQVTARLQNAGRVVSSEETFEDQVVRRWKVENVPVPELEPYRPPFNDIASKIELTTIQDWQELAQWQWSLTKDRFVADQAIKDKVAELTQGTKTRDEKIKAIADFVMREIQYKQDYTKPILGVQPHTAAQCFSNQRGDCKDKTTLLITMLGLVGIEAEFVMVKTRDQGDFRKDLPTNQWNHAIAYVRAENPNEPGMYIDGTALWEAYDVLPSGDQGIIATHLVDGKFEFKTIPIVPAEKNLAVRSVELTIENNGTASGVFHYKLAGNLATGFRYNLQTPSTFLADIQRYVGGQYPGAKTSGFRHSKSTDMDTPAWVEVDMRVNNMLRKNGDTLQLFEPASYRVSATRTYASQDRREYDMRFNLAQTRQVKRVYHLPKNMTPKDTAVQEVGNAYLNYKRVVEFENQTLTVITEMKLKVIEIPQNAYADIRKLCLEIDKIDQQPILLKAESE